MVLFRSANGHTLRVVANLSAQEQALSLPEFNAKTLLSNYADAPLSGRLRPYECAWLLAE